MMMSAGSISPDFRLFAHQRAKKMVRLAGSEYRSNKFVSDVTERIPRAEVRVHFWLVVSGLKSEPISQASANPDILRFAQKDDCYLYGYG